MLKITFYKISEKLFIPQRNVHTEWIEEFDVKGTYLQKHSFESSESKFNQQLQYMFFQTH